MISHDKLSDLSIWFVTGSQHLYGPEVLDQVYDDAQKIVAGLNASGNIPVRIVAKPVLTTAHAISQTFAEAAASADCAGIITWMHTFSPSQMWLPALQTLAVPMLHLHTQYNAAIPWDTIDMDFMNLNQSAHGGREFGFAATRLDVHRKVVVGHWSEDAVQADIADWCRVALARLDAQQGRIARFGDNMRQVAVTEGNKVSARIVFGYSVEGYGVGDLVAYMDQVADSDVQRVVAEYHDLFDVAAELQSGGDRHESLRYAARQEIALRAFLQDGGFTAFTTTFEDLHGLSQLPGLAPQRLMAEGYGFSGEGDWKTAAFLRASKIMAMGKPGGTSFMEDYTYNFAGRDSTVLGAHMLEICPSIAAGRPRIEIHPLGIGGKDDPVRAVFDGKPGRARNATIVDLGDRFRMIINEVEAVAAPHDMPNLPVARVLWKPMPDLRVAAGAWIHAGGAHHTVYSDQVTLEQFRDFADLHDIEAIVIDEQASVRSVQDALRWNAAYFRLR
ncbi:MAG: L-arabinose isomerase [Spirochaetaceae bacterium]|nr:MAG: L-arabinose isomerase [Spirochaetaceae bacterium]